MKVFRTVFTVSALSLALAGCSLFPSSDDPTSETSQIKEVGEMAKALESGKPISCVMTATDGSTTIYKAKDGKTYIEGADLAQGASKGYMVNDGDFTYIWSDDEAEGIKIAVPTESELEESVEAVDEGLMADYDIPDMTDQEDLAELEAEGIAYDCEQESVSDDTFVPPTNITFVDPVVKMQQTLDQMEEGSGIDPAQLESLMEEFGE